MKSAPQLVKYMTLTKQTFMSQTFIFNVLWLSSFLNHSSKQLSFCSKVSELKCSIHIFHIVKSLLCKLEQLYIYTIFTFFPLTVHLSDDQCTDLLSQSSCDSPWHETRKKLTARIGRGSQACRLWLVSSCSIIQVRKMVLHIHVRFVVSYCNQWLIKCCGEGC